MQVQNVCKVCPVCKAGIAEDKVKPQSAQPLTSVKCAYVRTCSHRFQGVPSLYEQGKTLTEAGYTCPRSYLYMAEEGHKRIHVASKEQR